MLADVNAVDASGERKTDTEGERLRRSEHLLITKDARRDQRESRDACGMSTWESAFRLGAAAGWARWTRALEYQSCCAYREPAGNGRRGDRASAASTPETPREEESGWDIPARKPEQLEGPLRELDAPVVVSSCPIIDIVIERVRFVERSDGAERAQRGQRRAERCCADHTRAEPTMLVHSRAKLHDACYCQI